MTNNTKRTKTGRVLSASEIDQISDEVATTDADVQTLRSRRRGRPPIGAAPAEVLAVRLDPALRSELDAYASAVGESVSAIVRSAISQHIRAVPAPRAGNQLGQA